MLAQQVVNGLMLGGIYVLVAVAFTLAIGVLNFLNFSIPGLFMLGGVVTWAVLTDGWHWSVAIGSAMFAAVAVAFLVERLSYRRSHASEPEVPLVSSLGFLVLLENLVLLGFGSDQQAFPALIPDFNFRVGGLIIGAAQLLSLAVSLGLVLWLSLFLRLTNTGRRVRTIAENRETAMLLGIDIDALVARVFVLSALFTALGGVLFAVNYLQVSPIMGAEVGFKGAAAMILGGMGSIWGAIAGGLLIGLAEVLSIHFIGANVVNIAVYGLVLILIILRPEGMFGRRALRESL